MTSGFVQSANQIFFSTRKHYLFFVAMEDDELALTLPDWFTSPRCKAYHCENCKKVIIDYSEESRT